MKRAVEGERDRPDRPVGAAAACRRQRRPSRCLALYGDALHRSERL